MLRADPSELKDNYQRQGFVVINELFDEAEVAEFQRGTDELVEQSKNHQESDSKFDLEPDHSEAAPRVQRIKVPHKQSEVFSRAVRNPKILLVLKILLGENVRFRNSKLNIKAARGGSAVNWHQDWAFYPHTNPDLLAVGIMIDDIDEDNAPLMVVPQSHLGKTLNHHYKGMTVVTWDSPIPSADGEQLFIAQVDFNETGTVMADMALNIIGSSGGEFAVLSASPDASNQNAWNAAMKEALKAPKYSKIKLVDLVYGDDQSEKSYNQALALLDKHPKLKLIMAPTTVGIASAAKAMQDEGLCDQVKVSGLGLPAEMVSYTMNGCAPEFALWSFVDLGYLSYYATYLLATNQIEGIAGETFKAGRMGYYTIEKDPTRDKGLRVLMGPFSTYNKDNVEASAK